MQGTLKHILQRFESIGDNAEFALLQRRYGINDVGLLKWCRVYFIDSLLHLLRTDFAGVYDYDNLTPRDLDLVVDAPSNLLFPTQMVSEMKNGDWRCRLDEAARRAIHAVEHAAVQDNIARFRVVLRDGSKILVFKANEAPDIAKVAELATELARFGPNTLLHVRPSDPDHADGTVERRSDALLIGYMSGLAPYWPLTVTAGGTWEAICAEAAALVDAAHGPARAGTTGAAVATDIHPDDFMFQYRLGEDPATRNEAQARAFYLEDGARSAARLESLVARFHPAAGRRTLDFLEFASGYGMVSRHLVGRSSLFRLTCSDIHPQAMRFLSDRLGIEVIPSETDPRALQLPRRFDVICALSLFSHLPTTTFGGWIETLVAALADDGILIFTTHGRGAYERCGCPQLAEDGTLYYRASEQKDLSLDDYGTLLIDPMYAFEQIRRCANVALLSYCAAYWWNDQDTFVLQRTTARQPRRADRDREGPGRAGA